jgi:stearoyl-CoA desaturase (Delta-9 desaturase)
MLGTVGNGTGASIVDGRTNQERPSAEPRGSGRLLTAGRVVTALLVAGPVVGLAVLLPLEWGGAFGLWDLAMAAVLYAFSGFGISVGFHRLFAHRSFKASRTLKILCAIAGSMALEGSIIGWVAVHRRHHMFGDQPGDPHSPHRYGSDVFGTVRGFLWAQVGWLFATNDTDTRRFALDLYRDPDLVAIDRLFPVLALASLFIPFAIGWVVYGTLLGGLLALLWAGLVRMAILHHVTWSINSVCHLWGRSPFSTSDRSTNVASLALVSFGESWHNFHHAAPSSARHGILRHQADPSAQLISLFERAGWATKVRWPSEDQIAALSKVGPSRQLALCRHYRSLHERTPPERPSLRRHGLAQGYGSDERASVDDTFGRPKQATR